MKLYSDEAIRNFYSAGFPDVRVQSPYFSIQDILTNLDAIPPSFVIQAEESYRICYVDTWQREHQKALFHKWVDNPITRKDGVQVMQTLALVEFEDGSVSRVEAKSIRFDDSPRYFEQHVWTGDIGGELGETD